MLRTIWKIQNPRNGRKSRLSSNRESPPRLMTRTRRMSANSSRLTVTKTESTTCRGEARSKAMLALCQTRRGERVWG